MSTAISKRVKSVTADRPQGRGLSVLPIVGPSSDQPAYELLSDKTCKKVIVTEVSDSGHVPELRVKNELDTRVFLMDGQELLGAKQNRILNTDVLVPASSTLTIPVSCVEQGRWHHTSEQFQTGKSASHRIRAAKMSRVHESLKQERGHDADQSAVWDEVQSSLGASGVRSSTSALHDAYAARKKELDEFRQNLQLPEWTVGVAIFQNGKFQGMDIFDRHSTLRYFWSSLVDSYALDLLTAPADESRAEVADAASVVGSILDGLTKAKWEAFASPGEGQDWRIDDAQYAASSLVWEDETVVHLQVFPKAPAADTGLPEGYKPRIRRPYGPSNFRVF